MKVGEGVRGLVLRKMLLPLGDRLFGQQMMRRLGFLEAAQWWPRERIEEARVAALRHTVRTAYRSVPFYRDLLDGAGVSPEQIRTVADLSRIPVVTKEALRAGYPDHVTRPTGGRTRENRTSGSTGTNFVVLTDAKTTGSYRAALMLMLEWAGWRPGEPHVQTGINPGRSLDRVLKDRLLRCHYVSAYDLTDAHLDETLDVIERRGIEHLWGYPGSIYHLARRALDRGWGRELRSVVTWGDMLFPRYRQVISQTFGCRVTDTYGCAEGIEVAGECGRGEGYHILDLDTVVEIVDGRGNPVSGKETGSLLLTRLYPGPMPLIRYRVGDLGKWGPDEACACGRGFSRLGAIEGRDTDVIHTPGGNRLIVHFFTGVLEHFAEIDSYQVVQESVGSLTLRVVPTTGFTPEVSGRVVKALEDRGADLRIDVEVVSSIPLERTGKRRFVVSKIRG